MHENDPQRVAAADPEPPIDGPVPTQPVGTPGRKTAKSTILGALVVGGIAGAAILGPLSAAAASPSPSAATTTSSATTTTDTTTSAATTTDTTSSATTPSSSAPAASPATGTDTDTETGGPEGGHNEAVSDTSVVAKAIGISEPDLKTALAGGQTVAAVAAAHNVPLQTVIDALVADGASELAAEVANGSITQAQADAKKAEILQRATAQANGTFEAGRDGKGGHNEAVSDTSVVAKAIGISEPDLKTALAGGQTVAAVAAAHSVPLQTVIDALVADGASELAAEVANGSITQAQADAKKAEILQRATAQANGTFEAGRP